MGILIDQKVVNVLSTGHTLTPTHAHAHTHCHTLLYIFEMFKKHITADIVYLKLILLSWKGE